MKTLKTLALLAIFSTGILHASAQGTMPPLNNPNYSRPKVFSDFPDKMVLRTDDLEGLLKIPAGARVDALLAKGYPLIGTVISQSNPADVQVKTVVIKLYNRKGATLTVTRIKETNGAFTYTGRLLNRTSADALEIVPEGTNYIIQKKGVFELVSE